MNRRGFLALGLTPIAAKADAPEVLLLVGMPVLELARHPAVGPRLRSMSAGRQRILSDALRGNGPAIEVTNGRWVHGHAATLSARIFLGFDTRTESVVIMLLEEGRPSLFIPPRVAPWPAALQPALKDFAPPIAAVMRFA